MSYLAVASVSIAIGLYFTTRALIRILGLRRAVKDLHLPADSIEWLIVRGKLISVLLVAFGLVFGVVASVLVVVYPVTPRPEAVRAIVTNVVVSWPVILGLLALNFEDSAKKESEAMAVNHLASGNDKEIE